MSVNNAPIYNCSKKSLFEPVMTWAITSYGVPSVVGAGLDIYELMA